MKKMTYSTMEFDAFLRSQSLQTNKISFFLGAGASIESGVLSAAQCILDWKKMIYDTNNPNSSYRYANFKAENCIREVQNWIDAQKIYPKLGDDNEYSFFAEAAIQDEADRCAYFNSIVQEAQNPSVGYKLLAYLTKQGCVDKIWTTNFDDLIHRAMIDQNIATIDITLDSKERIYLNDQQNSVKVIKLHGDYKYSKIKNTAKELDAQEDCFIEILRSSSISTDLVVIGYSGRDKSVMEAFEKVYNVKGNGRLFWLGYEKVPNVSVEKLLTSINASGRKAYYVPAGGFDATLLDITDIKFGLFPDKKDEFSKLIRNDNLNAIKPFVEPKGNVEKLISTNGYLLKCPTVFYQFTLNEQEKSKWKELQDKVALLKDVTARRIGDDVIFLGNKDSLQYVFGRSLAIASVPLEGINSKHHKLISLLTSALLYSIAQSNDQLDTDGKHFLWDKLSCKNWHNKYFAYNGLEIKITENVKYPQLALLYLSPKCYVVSNEENWDKTVIKRINDEFYNKVNIGYRANVGTLNYILDWHQKITNKIQGYKVCFGNNPEMEFTLGKETALLGVISKSNNNLANKRIICNAIEYKDPTLTFYDERRGVLVQDFHPMRGLIENAPYEKQFTPRGITENIKISVILPIGEKDNFANFAYKLNAQSGVIKNTDFILTYKGFYEIYKLPLSIPATNSDGWVEFDIPTRQTEADCKQLAKTIIECIKKANNANPGSIIVIYIPKYLSYFEEYKNENEHFDLHDYIKAFTVQQGIPTQFVKEKTLEYNDVTSVVWTLSLALYVKSGRIPWTIGNLTEERTAFVGLGYSIDTQNKNRPIVLGCSHIFSADGQSIKYRLSRVRNPQFDRNDKHRENPYLTEDEAYRLGCNINDMFRKSFACYPKRVVIHKRTPFKKEEIDGLTKSLSLFGITNIDLLTITYEDDLRTFQLKRDLEPDSYPIRRGVGFVADEKTMYLYTHGLANPIMRNYVMGGRSLPVPLKITKYYGNSSAAMVANDILGLTRMNWNNFNLYSKLPCTIEASNSIARIGYLLSAYEGAEYDYRLFI